MNIEKLYIKIGIHLHILWNFKGWGLQLGPGIAQY